MDRPQDHAYIVEFWATWCGPCRHSIPGLNLVHRLFADRVTLIAVSDEEPEAVLPFLDAHAGSMEFAVARDGARRESWESYMTAHGLNGIPHAFLVQGGEVLWHGHSARILREALPLVVEPDVIEERLDAREEGPFSGTVLHGEQPLTAYSAAEPVIVVRDSLVGGAAVPVRYDSDTATFTVDAAPMGSYSVSLNLTEEDGRRFRGSSTVFAEPGGTVEVEAYEVIRLTQPVNTAKEVESDIEIADRSPRFEWHPVEAAGQYSWVLYQIDDGRYARVDNGYGPEASASLGVQDSLEAGAVYEFRLYAYSSRSIYVGGLETTGSDNRIVPGLRFRVR